MPATAGRLPVRRANNSNENKLRNSEGLNGKTYNRPSLTAVPRIRYSKRGDKLRRITQKTEY
jgi:hypothetical protein